MKKALLLLFSIVLAGLLVACGDGEDAGTSEDNQSTEENTEQASGEEEASDGSEEAEATEEEEKTSDNKLIEINEEIEDNDNFKATLVSIERIYDETFDEEKIDVTFEVENKRDETIEFQAREVSIDGKMVDESLLMMSTEVSSGKSADAVLTIQDYEGGELPAMEEDFEMLLNVFSWDNMDYEEQAEVSVTFE
ncbi:hypothetical protein [Gracilibacillus suaedae]|uniref:hypothetical protein n=1 Tax=Gracilibacillus suaedae TaxID=2820273 RepID=UPI001ABE8514|nr:hypothetical protein [Gracilibacillus suaedae]